MGFVSPEKISLGGPGHSIYFSSTWWSVVPITRNKQASIIISARNSAEQTFTSLQIDKTPTGATILSNMKGSAHDSFPVLYHQFASELFTEYDQMRNPLVYIQRSHLFFSVIDQNVFERTEKNCQNVWKYSIS